MLSCITRDVRFQYACCARASSIDTAASRCELELELIQPHMAQKPVLRGEVGCACVAREVSAERGGMGERGCARRLSGWVGVPIVTHLWTSLSLYDAAVTWRVCVAC